MDTNLTLKKKPPREPISEHFGLSGHSGMNLQMTNVVVAARGCGGRKLQSKTGEGEKSLHKRVPSRPKQRSKLLKTLPMIGTIQFSLLCYEYKTFLIWQSLLSDMETTLRASVIVRFTCLFTGQGLQSHFIPVLRCHYHFVCYLH